MENPEKSQNKGGRTRQKAAVDEGFFRIILP